MAQTILLHTILFWINAFSCRVMQCLVWYIVVFKIINSYGSYTLMIHIKYSVCNNQYNNIIIIIMLVILLESISGLHNIILGGCWYHLYLTPVSARFLLQLSTSFLQMQLEIRSDLCVLERH